MRCASSRWSKASRIRTRISSGWASITELARNLGITVVAEGIERVAEWQIMAGLGCDVAQGFLIGRAMPADDVTQLLLSGQPLVETFAVSFGMDSARELMG